jgi:hypothetical protein
MSYSINIASFCLELNKVAKILFPEDWNTLCRVYDSFKILGLFINCGKTIFSNLSFDILSDVGLNPFTFYCFGRIFVGVL